VTDQNYSIILAKNPSTSISNNFTGDGTQFVWMNADSSQNAQDAKISLQALSQLL
jgi:hypothetical protein